MPFLIFAIVLITILFLLVTRKRREVEHPGGSPVGEEAPGEEAPGGKVQEPPLEEEFPSLNWGNVRKIFRFPSELGTILYGVRSFLEEQKERIQRSPIPVDPYAFTLAVRQQESGRPGREFGIMHPDALDTDLETQLEWFLATLLKDSIRWHTGKLWGGWSKDQFPDFIAYFAKKYAPTGAGNDPQGLNRFWEHNVRYFYALFSRKGE